MIIRGILTRGRGCAPRGVGFVGGPETPIFGGFVTISPHVAHGTIAASGPPALKWVVGGVISALPDGLWDRKK